MRKRALDLSGSTVAASPVLLRKTVLVILLAPVARWILGPLRSRTRVFIQIDVANLFLYLLTFMGTPNGGVDGWVGDFVIGMHFRSFRDDRQFGRSCRLSESSLRGWPGGDIDLTLRVTNICCILSATLRNAQRFRLWFMRATDPGDREMGVRVGVRVSVPLGNGWEGNGRFG